jgi:hypothetical protein
VPKRGAGGTAAGRCGGEMKKDNNTPRSPGTGTGMGPTDALIMAVTILSIHSQRDEVRKECCEQDERRLLRTILPELKSGCLFPGGML